VIRWAGKSSELVALEEGGEFLGAALPLGFCADWGAADGGKGVWEFGVVVEVDVLWEGGAGVGFEVCQYLCSKVAGT